jgi:hypothetical protein
MDTSSEQWSMIGGNLALTQVLIDSRTGRLVFDRFRALVSNEPSRRVPFHAVIRSLGTFEETCSLISVCHSTRGWSRCPRVRRLAQQQNEIPSDETRTVSRASSQSLHFSPVCYRGLRNTQTVIRHSLTVAARRRLRQLVAFGRSFPVMITVDRVAGGWRPKLAYTYYVRNFPRMSFTIQQVKCDTILSKFVIHC